MEDEYFRLSPTEPTPVSDLYVAAVIDKSGSMANKKNDIIGGYNTFVDSLKADKEGVTTLTLTLFDTEVITPVQNRPVDAVPHLNEGTYVPGGSTALYDAIVMTIGHVDAHLSRISVRPRVLLMVATDGEENSSRETTDLAFVKKLIEEKKKLGWAIVFLGENMDAWEAGTSLGIQGNNSRTVSGETGFRDAMQDMSAPAFMLRRSAKPEEVADNFFARLGNKKKKS